MIKNKYQHDDLENLMEELVFEQIDLIANERKIEMPSNEIDIQDIAALALNQLPPKYCCSILDKQQPRPALLKELENYKPLVREKVLDAINQVKQNPHH